MIDGSVGFLASISSEGKPNPPPCEPSLPILPLRCSKVPDRHALLRRPLVHAAQSVHSSAVGPP